MNPAACIAGTGGPLVSTSSGPLPKSNGFGTVTGRDILDFFDQPVHRFIPTDLFPFSLASFTDTPQGVTQSMGIIEDPGRGKTLAAHTSLTARIFRIPFDFYQFPVLIDFTQNAALRVTLETVRFYDLSAIRQGDDRRHKISLPLSSVCPKTVLGIGATQNLRLSSLISTSNVSTGTSLLMRCIFIIDTDKSSYKQENRYDTTVKYCGFYAL
jgi:hypothetical protein